ncbi:MAG: hypothetical protein ACE5G3_03955 [Gammaproteobacteria bacterium]
MKPLAIFRRHQTTWGRGVLGTFVAAWLAIILQPCAVAAGVEHGCPHCPPGDTHATSHIEAAAGADCALDGELNADARSLSIKLEDTFDKLPAAVPAGTDEFEAPLGIAQHSANPAVFPPPAGPPLSALYCVYLK